MRENTDPSEIDLVHLIIKVGTVIKSNIVIIVSFFAISIALGFFWFFQQKKVYESKLTISLEEVAETFSLIENLDKLLRENNYPVFAEKVKISQAVAKKISGIRVEKIDFKRDDLSDSEKDKVYLAIKIHVYDHNILSTFQKQLIQHLSNIEIVKAKTSQKAKAITKMIEKLTEEINTLEEFKKRIYKDDFFASTKGNIMFDPSEISTKIFVLTQEKMGYEEKLTMTADGVRVVSDFVPFSKPVSPNRNLMLLVSAFIGLFSASIVIAFKEFIKIVRLRQTEGVN